MFRRLRRSGGGGGNERVGGGECGGGDSLTKGSICVHMLCIYIYIYTGITIRCMPSVNEYIPYADPEAAAASRASAAARAAAKNTLVSRYDYIYTCITL